MSSGENESKTFTDEQLINSKTLQKLSALSRILPINASNPVEVEAALAPSFVFVIDAIDNNTIQFTTKADENAFFQILFVAHQLIVQPRPTSPTRH